MTPLVCLVIFFTLVIHIVWLFNYASYSTKKFFFRFEQLKTILRGMLYIPSIFLFNLFALKSLPVECILEAVSVSHSIPSFSNTLCYGPFVACLLVYIRVIFSFESFVGKLILRPQKIISKHSPAPSSLGIYYYYYYAFKLLISPFWAICPSPPLVSTGDFFVAAILPVNFTLDPIPFRRVCFVRKGSAVAPPPPHPSPLCRQKLLD